MEQDKGQASRPSDTARLLFLGREGEQGHGLTQQPLLSLAASKRDPMDCNPPGSSVRGILQAGILDWGAISFSRGPSQLGDRICVSRITFTGRQILYH